MMKLETVTNQILPVLRIFRARYTSGEPLGKAFSAAIREIAIASSVTYQTVNDGFARRLKLTISEVHALLRQWTEGNPKPLASLLKDRSDQSAHDSINTFFEPLASSSNVKGQIGSQSTSEANAETFSFSLPQKEARMLHTFAANDSVSEEEFIGQMIRTGLATRMKAAAQALMR